MSETSEQGEIDEDGEDLEELAAAYLEALESEPDQERLDEIENEIEELKTNRSQTKDDLGENSYLIDEITQEIESLREERDQIRESAETVDERRESILRAAAENPGFKPNKKWLTPVVTQALTHALCGETSESLIVAEQKLAEPADGEELDRSERIQVMREVAALSQDLLSGNQRVEKVWEELQGTRAYSAFQVIASQPGVGPSEIADVHDKNASTVRDWTSDLLGQEEFKLVYTPKRGEYCPSTIGEFYSTHYDDTINSEITEQSEPDDQESKNESDAEQEQREESDTDPSQLDLGNGGERRSGESVPKAEIRRDAAEADTTDEKRDQLFDEVSANRD